MSPSIDVEGANWGDEDELDIDADNILGGGLEGHHNIENTEGIEGLEA
jgi:hypothetical protein